MGTSQKHLKWRVLADKHYCMNAEPMKERQNKKKVLTFKIRGVVSVRVPRIDRAATDLHCLPFIVVACDRNKHFQYQLQCKYSVLERSYRESDLEASAGEQQYGNIQDWEKAPVVRIREAAKSANPSNAYYGAACHCKKGCSGNQCSYRKAGKPCSTRRHSGRSCVNCRDSNPEREPMRIKNNSTDSGSDTSAPNLQLKRMKRCSTDSGSGISPPYLQPKRIKISSIDLDSELGISQNRLLPSNP